MKIGSKDLLMDWFRGVRKRKELNRILRSFIEQLEKGSCPEPRGKTNGVQAGEKIRNSVVGIYILDPFQHPNGEPK